VPFTLFPAIDVTEGRLGAYSSDGPVPIDAFGGDPIAAAAAFSMAGATWLHVVDMDLAFTGEVRNADVIATLVAGLPQVRVQASGGIATRDAAETMLDAGASRVVLGSAVLDDPGTTRELLGVTSGRAIVGIEVDGGRIRARGGSGVDLDLMSTLGWLALTPGLQGLLVTSVARVGGLGGPDVDTVRRVMRRGFPVLAAGGIASLEDLVALREAGAVGAVIGRAVSEGSLDLGAALRWASV